MKLTSLSAEALDPERSLVAEETATPPKPCEVLAERVRRSSNWLDAFTALLWAVAAAAAIMLGLAIFLATDKQIPGTIAAGVGTVLASGGFRVLLNLRSAQQKELNHYVRLHKKQGCIDAG